MFSLNMLASPGCRRLFSPWFLARFSWINDDGLSYIGDYHEVMTFPKIISDLFVMAYATYVAALADASLRTILGCSLVLFCKRLWSWWRQAWIIRFWPIFWNSNLDSIWDSLNFRRCIFCHRVWWGFWLFFQIWRLPLSRALSWGIERRCHLHPNIPYLLNQFQPLILKFLGDHFAQVWNQARTTPIYGSTLRRYVGIHLKSKKFIGFPSRSVKRMHENVHSPPDRETSWVWLNLLNTNW